MKAIAQLNNAVVAFALVFPTVLTLAYFVLLAKQPSAVQQAVYAIGKAVQFGLPVVWVVLVLREPVAPATHGRGVVAGLAFGLAVVVVMLWLYHGVLKPSGLFEGPDRQVRIKITQLGLDTLWKYAAVGVFYALCHSFLEEYYWRWFVFAQLRHDVSLGGAIAISSLGFMAHHIVLLGVYFGWSSPVTYLFSLAVAVGGAVWAYMYDWSGSLYGPWLSHLLVDAGIFIIGYDAAREIL